MSIPLPRPHNSALLLNQTYEEIEKKIAKKQAEEATSPRTAAFARLEEGSSPLSVEPYDVPFDPLNPKMVEDRAISEERQRTDDFTQRVFDNDPVAIDVYETFKENPNLVNKDLLKKLKMVNHNALKIQTAFKKYKERRAAKPEETSFVNKLLSIFRITRGGKSKNKRKRRTRRKNHYK